MSLSAAVLTAEDAADRLTGWLRLQIADADDVRIEGLDRVASGGSAEMMVLTVVTSRGGHDSCRDVVVRMGPQAPHNPGRLFTLLRALESTPVRAPKALWWDRTGDVLGLPFLVMERVDGTVCDSGTLAGESDETVARMCRSVAEQLAAVHAVDLDATGLRALDDGATHLVRELDHWAEQMTCVECGPLPALERLLAALWDSMPAGCPTATLVHGDARPANFAFVDGVVGAVFAWELATVGDPLTDIGWLELAWRQRGGIADHPGALSVDELIAHYEAVSGRASQNRPWYRAFNAFKMAVICLIGAAPAGTGVLPADGVSALTAIGLADLGIVERR